MQIELTSKEVELLMDALQEHHVKPSPLLLQKITQRAASVKSEEDAAKLQAELEPMIQKHKRELEMDIARLRLKLYEISSRAHTGEFDAPVEQEKSGEN